MVTPARTGLGLRVVFALMVKVAVTGCHDTRLSALGQSERPEWVELRPSAIGPRSAISGHVRGAGCGTVKCIWDVRIQ